MTLYQLLADRALADDPSLNPNQCWEWPGAHRRGGYGVVYHDGRLHPAHRLAYSLVTGPIPDGLVVDHWVCSNPGCWRPSHLRAVTTKVNNSPERSRAPALLLARNAARTTCRNGHPYSADNTVWYYSKQGGGRHYRICRTCRKAQGQSQWASPGCHQNCPHTPHISTTGSYQAWLATTQSQHKETA